MKESNMANIKIPCEIYTRVSGYFRPLNQFNKGKQEEFRQRKDLLVPANAEASSY